MSGALLLDRVNCNITSTGTGSVTVGTAVDNSWQTPAQAGAVDTQNYFYEIIQGTDREWGVATSSSSGTVFSRTVTASIIGGTPGTSKINVAAGATWGCVSPKATWVVTADGTYLVITGATGSATGTVSAANLVKMAASTAIIAGYGSL